MKSLKKMCPLFLIITSIALAACGCEEVDRAVKPTPLSQQTSEARGCDPVIGCPDTGGDPSAIADIAFSLYNSGATEALFDVYVIDSAGRRTVVATAMNLYGGGSALTAPVRLILGATYRFGIVVYEGGVQRLAGDKPVTVDRPSGTYGFQYIPAYTADSQPSFWSAWDPNAAAPPRRR